jgi:hypothetical protein
MLQVSALQLKSSRKNISFVWLGHFYSSNFSIPEFPEKALT